MAPAARAGMGDSLGGLHALDKLGARMAEHFAGRVEWTRLSRQAELAAACATLSAHEVGPAGRLRFETAHPFPQVDLEVRARTDAASARLACGRPRWNGVPLEVRPGGPPGTLRVHLPLCRGELTWE